MNKNIISANLKSSSIPKFNNVTAGKNIVNTSLINTKNIQQDSKEATIDNINTQFDKNILKEYTLEELLVNKKMGRYDDNYLVAGEFGYDFYKDFHKSKLGAIDLNYENIYDLGYTPQGFTMTEDCYIISAYDKNKEENSVLFFYDNNGNLLGGVQLDNKTHVGGLTYDISRGLVYVTGDPGCVNVYEIKTLKRILSMSQDYKDSFVPYDYRTFEGAKLITLDDLNLNERVATTYYNNGYLYTASFVGNNDNLKSQTVFCKYKILYDEKTGNIIGYEKIYESEGLVCPQVQGIAVTEYKGKRYLLLAGGNISKISVYELEENGIKEYLGDYYAYDEIELSENYSINVTNKMAEGIDVNEKGEIMFINEDINSKQTTVLTMDIVLNNLESQNVWHNIHNDIWGCGYDYWKPMKDDPSWEHFGELLIGTASFTYNRCRSLCEKVKAEIVTEAEEVYDFFTSWW